MAEKLAVTEEAANAGLWSENLRTGAVTWSVGAYRILGLDPAREAPRALDRLEYLLSGYRETISRAFTALRAGEDVKPLDVQIRRPDGTLRDLNLSMRILNGPDGQPREIAGVIVDVSRAKTAERGMEERDEQVQRAVSASRSAIWDWDLQTGDFYISSRLAEMLDLPREPWAPSRALHDSLCHPEDRERVVEVLRVHADNGESFETEYRLRGSGPDVWVQCRGRAVSFRDGKPTRLIGSIVDITQRRELDAVIAEKQQMLELAVEAADAGYFEERFDTGEVTWSPRLRKIFGVASDEPARRGYMQERVYPEDLPEFLVAVEEWRRTLKPLDIEFRIRHADGRYIWLHVRAVHQCDSGGRRLRGVGFVLEVSDRLEAQRALADSERKFRNLVDGSIQGVVIHRRHKPLFCNPAYARLLGYDSVEDVLALPSLAPHLSPDNNEESSSFWERAVAGELDGRVFRRKVVRKNGREAWFEAVGRLIHWEEEPAWQMAVIEITDQMRIENELRSSEERFRFLADNATDILTLYDQDGLALYISPSAYRIAGYTVEETVGRSPFEFVHPDDAGPLRSKRGLQKAYAPQAGNARWRLRHKDGHWMWMESRAAVIPMVGGGHHVLTASRDISESVQREAEIQAARDRLQEQTDELALLAQNLEIERARAEQANLAKSQFLAMMSHELRTPLTGVLGMADLLLLSHQTEEQERVTKLLSRSARVLLDLLNDVLDFSKIEAGQLTVEHIPFSLASVLTEVSELYASMLDDKGLRFEVVIAPQVTDAVIGDPKRLRQVLSNLVNNAAKFTHQGEIRVSVGMEECEGNALRLRFSVADTGIGISDADAARLFKPFVQADLSTSRQYGGSGLGLAICKRLVEAMGGDIELESVPNRGSTFHFDIVVEAAGSLLPLEASNEADMPAAPARTLQILMAEDNDTTRYLVSAMLGRLGHRIVAVADGQQAVSACRAGMFDIILMDMQMPVMDGPDATRLIRQMTGAIGTVPIVALTADAVPEHRADFLAAGANAVVVKPVVWLELGEVIDQLVPGGGIARRVARGLTKAEGDRGDLSPPMGSYAQHDLKTAPAIDNAVLDDLAAALGEAAVANMMPTFLVNMIEYRDQLASAIAGNDLAAAKRAAHALKGLAAQFGAPQVSALARSIELDCLTVTDVAEVLGKLVSAVAVAAQAIKARGQARANTAPIGPEN